MPKKLSHYKKFISLILFLTYLLLKCPPIDEINVLLKEPSEYLNRIAAFPTPASPMSSNLNKKS